MQSARGLPQTRARTRTLDPRLNTRSFATPHETDFCDNAIFEKNFPTAETDKPKSKPSRAGPNRRLYLPAGLLDINTDVPSYMNGTLAGDYGFDPLKLGADGKIEQYRVAEVIHARWAMLAIPGIVIPEALGVPGGVWTETGKVFLDGETGRPEILGNPYIFTAIEVALMAGVEGFRSGKIEAPSGFAPIFGKFEGSDFSGLDPINPGGPLDFFNVAATPRRPRHPQGQGD